MKIKELEVKLAKSMLSMCGITVNETYLGMVEHKYLVATHRFDRHVEDLVESLRVVLGDAAKIRVHRTERLCQITINDQLAVAYKQPWWSDKWVCKRTEYHRVDVRTVDFGDFVGGLLDIAFSVVLGPAKGEVSEARVVTNPEGVKSSSSLLH